MTLTENERSIRMNESLFRWISYLLVAAMVACAAMTIGSLVRTMLPTWKPWILGLICFIVSLDSLFMRRQLKNQSLFGPGCLSVAITQAVIILVVVKIATGLSFGITSFLNEVSNWGRDFAGSFITMELILGLVLAVLAWFISSYFGELLDEMELEQARIRQTVEISRDDDDQPPRERLKGFIYGMLICLVISTALVRVDFRSAFSSAFRDGSYIFRMSPLEGGGGATLVFFMLALALLSQTQFIHLHTNWSLANIAITPKLSGRWARYSILFLIILAVIASLLPTYYSLGLLSYIGMLVDLVFQVVSYLMLAIFTLFSFLASLPFNLLQGQAPAPVDANVETIAPTPQVTDTPSEPGFEPNPLRMIIFWIVVIGVVVFFLIQYLRQHEEVLAWMRKIPGWSLLSRFWVWINTALAAAGKNITVAIEGGRARLRAIGEGRRIAAQGGYLNPRRLGPRQKVFFYYLNLIRRGGEKGIPRQKSQTPAEYARILDNALPDAEEDINQLTDAFVEARYSRHQILADDASRAQNLWDNIRKFLRKKG